MTNLKMRLIVALSFVIAAACVPVGEAPYVSTSKPVASMVSYPAIAQGAVADGNVFEYH